jgi:hypothetical protein
MAFKASYLSATLIMATVMSALPTYAQDPLSVADVEQAESERRSRGFNDLTNLELASVSAIAGGLAVVRSEALRRQSKELLSLFEEMKIAEARRLESVT